MSMLGARVELRRSPRARRLILRVDPPRRQVVAIVPEGIPLADAESFVARNRGWIAARLAALPPLVPYAVGATIPVLGIPLEIRDGGRRGTVRRDGPAVIVPGGTEHHGRRLIDWLKAEMRSAVRPEAEHYARLLGRPLGRLALRETASRWGSCTSRGDISLNWRLVHAPRPVLTYVVAHECAHLVERSHAPRFWRLLESLLPDHGHAREWLRRRGAELWRYQATGSV